MNDEYHKSETGTAVQEIPEFLPILPLKDVVIYPTVVVPLAIGREDSIQLIEEAAKRSGLLGIVAQRDSGTTGPDCDNIYSRGTAVRIRHLLRQPDGTLRIIVQGLARIQIRELTQTKPYLAARISVLGEEAQHSLLVDALMTNAVVLFQTLMIFYSDLPEKQVSVVLTTDDPAKLVYTIAGILQSDLESRQRLLDSDSIGHKLKILTAELANELQLRELGKRFAAQNEQAMDTVDREVWFQEQIGAAVTEVGGSAGDDEWQSG
jgi:ATP-dependent Lon protease